MSVRIVRLGTPRAAGEGLRLGTVRRPPRGVPKDRFAAEDWYDVWLPVLAPSPDLMAEGRASTTDAEWARFLRRYAKEMSASDPAGVLDALARLSHQADFAVGCYCEVEDHCHRSALRRLLAERGADIADVR
jgi:uncharacterized protein YeaO (DUF488 family)